MLKNDSEGHGPSLYDATPKGSRIGIRMGSLLKVYTLSILIIMYALNELRVERIESISERFLTMNAL